MARIYPSLISADLLNLEQEIKILEPHVDGFHIDIMDNHFVPNLTWGPDMVNVIATVTKKPLWVHLMVSDPLSIIKRLSLTPQSLLTFHIECIENIKNIIIGIIEKNALPGIAIRPKTDPEQMKLFLHDIHHVLPMSVEPGFSGQKFLPETIDTVKQLHEYKSTQSCDYIITGDGGINKDNIRQLYEYGVEDFAIASAIFSEKDRVGAIQALRDMLI